MTKNKTKIAYSFSEDSISFVINDKQSKVIRKGNANYGKVKQALLDADYDAIPALLDPKTMIEEGSDGKVTVEGNSVFFNHESGEKEQLHGVVVKKLISLITQGAKDINPLKNFIERLMNNPSSASVDQLFDFLQYKELPITPDGYFIAYKAVRNDYKDKHTGKVDNSVGATPRMRRNQVDDNRGHDCSYGYHAGSLDYAKWYANSDDRIMLVKVDPADAVSVPTDHQCQKLRIAGYEVIAEHTNTDIEIGNAVYDHEEDEIIEKVDTYEDDYDDVELNEDDINKLQIRNYINNRHSNGVNPTVKQVQSRMKGITLSCADIILIAESLGFEVETNSQGVQNSYSKILINDED